MGINRKGGGGGGGNFVSLSLVEKPYTVITHSCNYSTVPGGGGGLGEKFL